jgi:hypothetical protein
MRSIQQESVGNRVDHLRAALIGRTVERNGSGETATVLAVNYSTSQNAVYLTLSDGRQVPSVEWTLAR